MGWAGSGTIALPRKLAVVCALAMALVALTATRAGAVPAFGAQTGEPCQACHVGGFGPQLTPLGREFKLQGYTLRTNDKSIPLSVMAVASYLQTQKPQNPPPGPGFNSNDNWALDQVSLFLAGGFGQHFGAFVQGTYDGITKAWTWDNLDLRAVTALKADNHDATLGVSLNNSPTVQDAWNTLPAWGYPYTDSELAPGPSASPLLSGALAQTTLGMTGYAWIDSKLYLEGGAYWSPSAGALSHLGVDPTDPGAIRGAAPYGRIAWQQDLGPGTFEAGVFGMETEIYPGLGQHRRDDGQRTLHPRGSELESHLRLGWRRERLRVEHPRRRQGRRLLLLAQQDWADGAGVRHNRVCQPHPLRWQPHPDARQHWRDAAA